jgi:hypothetical protein
VLVLGGISVPEAHWNYRPGDMVEPAGGIVNLTGEQKEGTPLEILWTSYIGGPAGSTIQGDVTRMTEAIDQAFKQSEYLKNK